MSDRPIIFSASMILALLAGRKTQTRRVLHPQPQEDVGLWMAERKLPYAPGDRLWVRENLQCDRMVNFLTGERDVNAAVAYYAADDTECLDPHEFNFSWIWKRGTLPSLYMPRAFSRLTLLVETVKVERLQEISEEDACAEGIAPLPSGRYHCGHDEDGYVTSKSPITAYAWLWNSLHGEDAWGANPWVVAPTFRVVKANIDAVERLAA